MPAVEKFLIQQEIEELQMRAEAKFSALMDLIYQIFELKRRLEPIRNTQDDD